jgi:hypothetical protein
VTTVTTVEVHTNVRHALGKFQQVDRRGPSGPQNAVVS